MPLYPNVVISDETPKPMGVDWRLVRQTVYRLIHYGEITGQPRNKTIGGMEGSQITLLFIGEDTDSRVRFLIEGNEWKLANFDFSTELLRVFVQDQIDEQISPETAGKVGNGPIKICAAPGYGLEMEAMRKSRPNFTNNSFLAAAWGARFGTITKVGTFTGDIEKMEKDCTLLPLAL